MLLRSFQHVIVRRRLVFVIVRLAIIFAHREVFELVPHQNPPQIWMAVELDSIEVKNFPLLKFRAPPNRSERRQSHAVGAIGRAHPNDDRPVLVRYRVEVINRFEIAGNCFLNRLVNFLFHAVDDGFYLCRFLYDLIEPINAGRIRTEIESQRRVIAQKFRDRDRMFIVDLE